VQQIEGAIGEDDLFALSTPLGDPALEFVASENLLMSRIQCDLVTGGPSASAFSISCRLAVAVPRFITTMPPA
jgi:hypothetical protein